MDGKLILEWRWARNFRFLSAGKALRPLLSRGVVARNFTGLAGLKRSRYMSARNGRNLMWAGSFAGPLSFVLNTAGKTEPVVRHFYHSLVEVARGRVELTCDVVSRKLILGGLTFLVCMAMWMTTMTTWSG